jgi:NADPH:quinone reductase-like Zn-dependent oxidoreductase/NADP-dependent 3-hydroxy acid dehydrogenase YdfG/acyl carrier protein
VLGLVRSAQSEHSGRFLLVDLDPSADRDVDWGALLAAGESQLAVRGASVLAPRLVGVRRDARLAPPPDEPYWCLGADGAGTLDDLALVPAPRPIGALESGNVMVAMRAVGLNFRDVLLALNSYAGRALIGSEGAGIVVDVGPDVEGLAVGDRVMGSLTDAFGPAAFADYRGLVRIPDDWSFVEGASWQLAFVTAYHGLFDMAELQPGERVLIHAGAGGVGMAAIQLAQSRGAEVFATASPPKWDALRELGIDDDHLASSRDLAFREKFLAATGEKGVDVVLNALAGDFIDASLDLLSDGGRFIEMGKADIRDARQVAAGHPGVEYEAFEIHEHAGIDRMNEIMKELMALFAAGSLRHHPIVSWDVRRAVSAFRYLRDGRNVGKVVLTIPQSLDPKGTVLITGGTGSMAAEMARQLAAAGEVGHLLLVSRRGPDADGASELRTELAELGCEAEIVACDVTDRAQLADLIDSIPPERSLTGVIHAAGVLEDGLIETLDAEQVARVMGPKADAALHLHELTEHLDLAQFVLFSSAAAIVGSPGQGNYAAANAFLDALVQSRRVRGLPGQSLAWGLWDQEEGVGMGGLAEADAARMSRLGVVPLSSEEGLQLLDLARSVDEPLLVPMHFDLAGLRAFAGTGLLPRVLSGLVRAPVQRERTGGRSLARRLSGVPEDDRAEVVLEAVRTEVAAVLGYDSIEAIDSDTQFKDLGFDSLAAVEMYNRLCQATGLRLPTTLGFDYPTPRAVAEFICAEMEGETAEEEQPEEVAEAV